VLTRTDRVTHSPILETRSYDWRDESDCAAFAQRLAARAPVSEAFIALQGPLGAGKTTFARHLLRALGIGGRIKSPTFALLEHYERPGLQAAHLDFYRFSDPREWLDAGLRDVFAEPGLKLAEWPEKAGSLLPDPDLQMQIHPVDETRRQVVVHAFTPRGVALLP